MSLIAPDPYYCIIALPEEPVADLCVLAAASDRDALHKAEEIARAWPGWSRVDVYQGERRVALLENSCSEPAFRAAA